MGIPQKQIHTCSKGGEYIFVTLHASKLLTSIICCTHLARTFEAKFENKYEDKYKQKPITPTKTYTHKKEFSYKPRKPSSSNHKSSYNIESTLKRLQEIKKNNLKRKGVPALPNPWEKINSSPKQSESRYQHIIANLRSFLKTFRQIFPVLCKVPSSCQN